MLHGLDIYDLPALPTQHDENQSPRTSYLQTAGHLPATPGYFTPFIKTSSDLFVVDKSLTTSFDIETLLSLMSTFLIFSSTHLFHCFEVCADLS